VTGVKKDGVNIAVVIPAYNEEGNIAPLIEKLDQVLNKFRYKIIFVDDGSTDTTLEKIKELRQQFPSVEYITLSRNFGHQNALKAGLDFASGQCVITMDADLQHPPQLIPEMIAAWKDGNEIVYTIRDNNHSVPLFKRFLSKLFYFFINLVSEVKIHEGTADFRLLDISVVEVLRRINESTPFYRGIIPWMGFKQASIHYNPSERYSGKSKYSLRQMIKFAVGGLTSFSVVPLRIATYLGFFMAISGFLVGVNAVYESLFTDKTVPGWTSIIVLVVLVGGVQLIMLGIIGEYLGKLFVEAKKRPHYIVRGSSLDGKDQT
jgi:dolichol-phosphate mannosyltransferase